MSEDSEDVDLYDFLTQEELRGMRSLRRTDQLLYTQYGDDSVVVVVLPSGEVQTLLGNMPGATLLLEYDTPVQAAVLGDKEDDEQDTTDIELHFEGASDS